MNSKKNICKQLFTTFFKIGAFTFGGGFAMMPLIEKEVVDKSKWISKEDLIDTFAVSQSIPGAIAINTATLIGYKVCGKLGALVSTFGVVTPSFITISIIYYFLKDFENNTIVQYVFQGIKAAVCALIIMAFINVAKVSVKDKCGVIIILIVVFLTMILKVNPIFIILSGILAGSTCYLFTIKKVNSK